MKTTVNAAEAAKVQEMRAKIGTIRKNIDARKCRSAWDRGVNLYASELLDNITEAVAWYEEHGGELPEISQKWMMNGAGSWARYSRGGCSLVADEDIAARLCSPSELRRLMRKDGSLRRPNALEDWLDVQARALFQAATLILDWFWKLGVS